MGLGVCGLGVWGSGLRGIFSEVHRQVCVGLEVPGTSNMTISRRKFGYSTYKMPMDITHLQVGFSGRVPLSYDSCIVPLKQIEYGFGHIITRSPYTPYSIYLRGTVGLNIVSSKKLLSILVYCNPAILIPP